MIDETPREFKADVFHTVQATADTIQEISDNAQSLAGKMVACREDQFLYYVCNAGIVEKTNLKSREVI